MKERLKSQPQSSPCFFPPTLVQQTSASMMLCADTLTTNPCHDSQGWDKVESTQLTSSKRPYNFVMFTQTATPTVGRRAALTGVVMVSPALQPMGGCLTSAVPTARQPTPTCPNLGASNRASAAALEDAGGQITLPPMMSHLLARKPAKSQLGQTLHLGHGSKGVPRRPKC